MDPSNPTQNAQPTNNSTSTGTEVQSGGEDQAAKFEQAFYDQLSMNAVFDGYGEEQKLRSEQKERENNDRTV
ncbi:MAG: hypothetical protein ACRBM6_20955 [Geminicoccales bacterium]